MTGDEEERTTGVTDTTAATWTSNTLAELPTAAKQWRNVFLYRTGSYVATTERTSASCHFYGSCDQNYSYTVGSLPTVSEGHSFGPVDCPTGFNLLTSEKAK